MCDAIPKARNLPKVKKCLSALYGNERRKFEDLFLLERSVVLAKGTALPLVKANLIRTAQKGRYVSNVRIWKIKGNFIVTDLFSSMQKDRVYPIFTDESDFLAKNLIVRVGDSVLDLCTGSGIHAICCAEKAAQVLATDISSRALSFALFNAKLNSVSCKIKFARSDLFSNIGKKRFDLIVCNPPFIAVPDEESWFMHGSAGLDGLAVIRRVLKDSKAFLNPNGRLQILANSFCTSGKIVVIELAKRHFLNSLVRAIHVFSPPKIAVGKYVARFSGASGFGSWNHFLRKKRFDSLCRVLINILPAKRFLLEEIQHEPFRFYIYEAFKQKPTRVKPYYSGGWDEMLQRYGNTGLFFKGRH